MRYSYHDPAATHTPISPERARLMAKALRSGADPRVLAEAYNTTPQLVRHAAWRYERGDYERRD